MTTEANIQRTLGQLETGLRNVETGIALLREEMQREFKRGRDDMEGLIEEVRKRYHEQNNETQKKIVGIDNRLITVEKKIAGDEGRLLSNRTWRDAILVLVASGLAILFELVHGGHR